MFLISAHKKIIVAMNKTSSNCCEFTTFTSPYRGPSYMENSEKVVSREAVFSILGANNILNRKVETIGHVRTGPDDFVKKFRLACSQAGVQTPFL